MIDYETDDGVVKAVGDISINVNAGETLGLVGETGAGKTTTALGVMRLVPDPPGRIKSGRIIFEGEDLLNLSPAQMRKIRGKRISMIFQDPMTALNPILTVGQQIAEGIRNHTNCNRNEAMLAAIDMLEKVGIPAIRSNNYPHQFSGGMKQRVVIAMAMACEPQLLIADEPTTALDVTIQAQMLNMVNDLKREHNTAMLLITHDLGVVAETCDSVAIMYAGEIMEYGTIQHIFNETGHPYTKGLFNSIPSLENRIHRLIPIKGLMPDPMNLPSGCKFHPRCTQCTEQCKHESPDEIMASKGHLVKCHYADRGVENGRQHTS